ncbi:MAG: alpha/beta hydrolase [Myxococcota bacterium]
MLNYLEYGSGSDTAFLLHGFLGSARNLRSLAQRWCEYQPQRHLILPDLTGHGHSPALSNGDGLERLAHDVLELATHLKLSSPALWVGHSLGGRVALKARLLQPHRMRSIVLLDIAPGPVSSSHGEVSQVVEILLQAPAEASNRQVMRDTLLAKGLPRHLVAWLILNLENAASGAVRWRIDRQAMAYLHRQSSDEDLWAAAETPHTKTRCIYGEKSDYVSLADRHRFQMLGVPLNSIEEAGHFLHIDALGKLVQLLAEIPLSP